MIASVRKHRKAILWTVTSLLVLPMLFVAGIYITHPRNEGRFMAAMERADFPDDWQAFVADRGEDFLLTEGDRACDWLSDQSFALLNGSDSVSLQNRMNRYLDETSNVNAAWVLSETTFDGRRLAAAAGWNYLCEATLLVHQPYNVFGDPGGDS